MKYHLLLCLCLCLCLSAVSSAQQITFSKVFSNFPLNPENGWKVQEVPGGYLLLGGMECLDFSGNNCTSLMLLNPEGNVVWQRTLDQVLGFQDNHLLYFGNKIYVSGSSNDQEQQFSVSCYDLAGNYLWKKTYGNPLHPEWPAGIIRSGNNRLVLYGDYDRMQNHPYQWLPTIVTIDTLGNELGIYAFNEQYDASSVNAVLARANGDLIASYVYCPDGCVLSLYAGLTCFDSTGLIQWELNFPPSYLPWNCLVKPFDDNHLAAQWYVDNNAIPDHDLTPPAIFFTDMNGAIQDTLVFQNQTLKEILGMEPVTGKGLVGSGFEYIDYLTQSNAPKAGWLFRLDNNREIVWERTYLDSTWQGRSYGLRNFIPTSDGGYLAVGAIVNEMTGVEEVHNWVLKLDSLGCLEPGCDNLNYITDAGEPVFLSGIGVDIAPNPASNYLVISVPEGFDVQNTRVLLLSNAGQITVQHNLQGQQSTLDVSGITPGIYYLLLVRGNEIVTSEKIIIQR